MPFEHHHHDRPTVATELTLNFYNRTTTTRPSCIESSRASIRAGRMWNSSLGLIPMKMTTTTRWVGLTSVLFIIIIIDLLFCFLIFRFNVNTVVKQENDVVLNIIIFIIILLLLWLSLFLILSLLLPLLFSRRLNVVFQFNVSASPESEEDEEVALLWGILIVMLMIMLVLVMMMIVMVEAVVMIIVKTEVMMMITMAVAKKHPHHIFRYG